MMSNRDIIELLNQAIDSVGEQRVSSILRNLSDGTEIERPTLTIVANGGMHSVPVEYIHGEEYVASQGNLDLSNKDAIVASYVSVLKPLANKLRERQWGKIHLIPTGPPTLSAQIKLLVYHITRMSTIDLFYSQGFYSEIDLDYREYLADE